MDAEGLLRRMGISGKLKGFPYAVYMIDLVSHKPEALELITKRLYPETAKYFGVSAGSVERNLRTLVRACWYRGDRAFMEKVAECNLPYTPTNAAFVDMMAAYLRRRA